MGLNWRNREKTEVLVHFPTLQESRMASRELPVWLHCLLARAVFKQGGVPETCSVLECVRVLVRIPLRAPWAKIRGVGHAVAVIQLQVSATKVMALVVPALSSFQAGQQKTAHNPKGTGTTGRFRWLDLLDPASLHNKISLSLIQGGHFAFLQSLANCDHCRIYKTQFKIHERYPQARQ